VGEDVNVCGSYRISMVGTAHPTSHQMNPTISWLYRGEAIALLLLPQKNPVFIQSAILRAEPDQMSTIANVPENKL
jgi:hypothetical protein